MRVGETVPFRQVAPVVLDRLARRHVGRLAERIGRLAFDLQEPAWAQKAATLARSLDKWCRRISATGGAR